MTKIQKVMRGVDKEYGNIKTIVLYSSGAKRVYQEMSFGRKGVVLPNTVTSFMRNAKQIKTQDMWTEYKGEEQR